jgi:hypothetical protein
MDIAALSMAMSQSNVQIEASIAVTKMAMDTNKKVGAQITEMMKDVVADPNLVSKNQKYYSFFDKKSGSASS